MNYRRGVNQRGRGEGSAHNGNDEQHQGNVSGGRANSNGSVIDIFSGETLIERKTFIFDLKENPRGRFLRITEEVGIRKDIIIIPATGLHRFRDLLERAIEANEKFTSA